MGSSCSLVELVGFVVVVAVVELSVLGVDFVEDEMMVASEDVV